MNLQHHFLIAMPTLQSDSFNHTVVYICQHTPASGAIGFIINRKTNLVLSDVFEQMDIEINSPEFDKTSVLAGGPMQTDKGFVLHQSDNNLWKASLNVNDCIRITTSKDVLEDFASDKLSDNNLLLLGYAGWQSGQLEQEVADNYWLVTPADLDILFDVPLTDRRKAAARLIGVDINNLSHSIGHA